MTKITFNSKAHLMEISFEGKRSKIYKDVMTIKTYEGFYEILQRQFDERVAPLFRLPITNTIIEYSHKIDE
jgi:hypothetical protein